MKCNDCLYHTYAFYTYSYIERNFELTFQGAPGPTGPQGEQGQEGQMGKTGLQGIAGRNGEKGQQGMQGFQGLSGTPGLQVNYYICYSNQIEEATV